DPGLRDRAGTAAVVQQGQHRPLRFLIRSKGGLVVVRLTARIALVASLASIAASAVRAQQAAGIPTVTPDQMPAVAGPTTATGPLVDEATTARDRPIAATFPAPGDA